MPEKEYSGFEWQANEFAGRLLVPYPELTTEFDKILKIIEEKGEYGSLSYTRGLAVLLAIVGALLVVPSIISIVIMSNIWYYAPVATQITQVLQLAFIFLLAALPTSFAARTYTVKEWEKKNQKQILNDSGFITMRVFAAQPAPPPPPPNT